MLTTLAVLGVLGAASLPVQQSREEAALTIAVSVDLVVLNVTVTDRQGRAVSGLTAADFVVSEDNRTQAIALFSAEDVPAAVGLVIDNSGSMADKRADVVNAALGFAAGSRPGDELFVVNFNEHAALGLPPSIPFANDVGQLRAALAPLPTGQTALYDALALGLQHLNGSTRERKALVVLSDGGDNASRRSLDEVLDIARRSSATIYTIGVYDETNRDSNPRALRRIASLSGGRAYFPRALTDLRQVWADIAGGIRSQYTLGYHSTNTARDGTFRKVTITASRSRGGALRVSTRDGYLAPGGHAK